MDDTEFSDPARFRVQFVRWLDERRDELAPPPNAQHSLDAQVAHFRMVKRTLFDAGWGRYGWPAWAGGLGGPPILRAIVGEELTVRDVVEATLSSMIEVLGPTVLDTANPALAAAELPAALRGDIWCQGFSEPDAGSDLAALACAATAVDGGFRLRGQKVWTSFVQYASRCVVLARTGAPGSAHRGITAFFVDVDSPGLTYRPLTLHNGREEFAEVFYDDVFVPNDRVLGDVDGGWKVAMDILPYERSTTFWHRGALLHHRLEQVVDRLVADHPEHPGSSITPAVERGIGSAFQALIAFRCRSRATQHRLAAGERLGAETSIDKMLVTAAETGIFDLARDALPGEIEFGSDDGARRWREDFLYSRAAPIYGGTAEIQRNIVARRLLDLGEER